MLALFAVPAMAELINAENATMIYQGETVYYGEQNLNITPALAKLPVSADQSALKLYHYTSTEKNVDKVVNIPSNNITSITNDFYGYTGTWYGNGSGMSSANIVFVVQEPKLAVAVKSVPNAGSNSETDVGGKKVVDETNIRIILDTNFVGMFQRVGMRIPGNSSDGIDVKVITPTGATLTGLKNESGFVTTITGQRVTSQLNYVVNTTALDNGTELAKSIWYFTTKDNAYSSGTYTITAEVNVNKMKDNYGSVSGKTVAAAVTVELDKETVTITADKETVIRNNDFSVTVDGSPKQRYIVWVSGTGSGSNVPPFFTENQKDVKFLTYPQADKTKYTTSSTILSDVYHKDQTTGDLHAAVIANTSSSGTITIGLTTGTLTDDSTFKIRAQKVDESVVVAGGFELDKQLYDSVKVKIEKGAVTITASGDGSYYLGEEVVLSGTNTDTDSTYLFITGPNLPTNGGIVSNPAKAINYTPGSDDNTKITVKTDDTWEFKWDTSAVSMDAGTYTIYATSGKYVKDALSDTEYDTVSIVVKKPFVTATTSASTVAKGDKLYIRGTAEGNPTQGVAIWILGKNYWNGHKSTGDTMITETVNDDGSFEYEFGTADTKNLASGQYFVVVQHPMYNGNFDVLINTTNAAQTWVEEGAQAAGSAKNSAFVIWGNQKLQGSDAAEALIDAINSADVDDTYTKLTFLVEEPWIRINTVGDHYIGDSFKITGTTNLAVGDNLIVEVTSSSFQPTQKTQSGEFSGVSGTVIVTTGTTYNEWAMDVDASTFKADEYIVNVEAIEADVTATTTFNILSGKATVTATATKTVAPTTAPTAAPTTVATPKTTASPGFGAIIALIGLGAVAALVMRKD